MIYKDLHWLQFMVQ